jgi:hypothetical protein
MVHILVTEGDCIIDIPTAYEENNAASQYMA